MFLSADGRGDEHTILRGRMKLINKCACSNSILSLSLSVCLSVSPGSQSLDSGGRVVTSGPFAESGFVFFFRKRASEFLSRSEALAVSAFLCCAEKCFQPPNVSSLLLLTLLQHMRPLSLHPGEAVRHVDSFCLSFLFIFPFFTHVSLRLSASYGADFRQRFAGAVRGPRAAGGRRCSVCTLQLFGFHSPACFLWTDGGETGVL